MQQKSILLAVSALLLIGVGFFSSFSFERVYDYAQTEQKINIISSITSESQADVVLPRSFNSWTLALAK